MANVTVGHDSCQAWTTGGYVSPDFNIFDCWDPKYANTVGQMIDMQRSWTAPLLPIYWLYKGTKAVSKSIRTSR